MPATTKSSQRKERPILFSGEMVRAILEGRKTQTRRIIKNEARGADRVIWISKDQGRLWPGRKDEPYEGWAAQVDKLNGLHLPLKCPHGEQGDRLWVREAFQINNAVPVSMHGCGLNQRHIFYRASNGGERTVWKPSIHMPRWASRITLGITGIRVERLSEISEADAKAEGVEASRTMEMKDGSACYSSPFQILWEQINGVDSWAANPWVWVIEFKKL